MKALAKWIADGTPWVWLIAAAVSASILLVAGLLILIGVRGMGHFWPAAVGPAKLRSSRSVTVVTVILAMKSLPVVVVVKF